MVSQDRCIQNPNDLPEVCGEYSDVDEMDGLVEVVAKSPKLIDRSQVHCRDPTGRQRALAKSLHPDEGPQGHASTSATKESILGRREPDADNPGTPLIRVNRGPPAAAGS